MSWLVFVIRRFILPAVTGAYLGNLGVYYQLGSEGGATDWQSILALFVFILPGFILTAPLFLLIRRQCLPATVTILLLLALGAIYGIFSIWMITIWLALESVSQYIHYGLLVGPVSVCIWFLFNFDLLRTKTRQQGGE